MTSPMTCPKRSAILAKYYDILSNNTDKMSLLYIYNI